MDSGFSLAEIMTMQKKPDEQKPEGNKPEEQKPEGNKPEEQKPEGNKPEEQKPKEQNETDSLKNEIAELKKMIQNQNRKNAQQPYAEPERTIEDIFNDLINPKRKGEDDK